MDEHVLQKIDSFFTKYKPQTYRKGELLIRADDTPSGVFYLKEGLVKEYAISRKGDELVVNVFKSPAFFPMSWAMNKTPNTFFFEAVNDVHAYKAPAEDVIAFIKQHPDVLYDLMRRVYKGTDGLLTRITYLMAGNAYGRLITELLIQAKRFGERDGKSITLKISETDLATRSGMTRETVSREMKVLKEKNLVEFGKGILIIMDRERLELELSEGV